VDFYHDSNTDILWQNDNDSAALWDMDGTAITQSGLATTPSKEVTPAEQTK
jgi:hypothetical protein